MSKLFREWEENVDKESKEWLDFQKQMEYDDAMFNQMVKVLDWMMPKNNKGDKDE